MRSALLAAALLVSAGCADRQDPLAARGVRELGGVASGMVSNEDICAGCHPSQASGYRTVAMSRSTSVPGVGAVPEAAPLEYFHEASGRHYRLEPRDGGIWFSRWLSGPNGERRHMLELPVDLVVGSGAHARSYVVRTNSDELLMLPVTWYEGLGLRMSPGFDRADHLGITRAVRRDCLVCHASTPELPTGGDLPHAPERFPTAIEPIGCQRCHGPGGEHARLAFAGARDAARAALVDLATLPADRQLAVCESCHLQPSVALAATRGFDRGEYAFEPGMALGEHRIAAEVKQRGRATADVFEINHHAWRLRQSACFLASGGRPVCTDCHDPHRKLDSAALAAEVRTVCSECHRADRGCSELAGRRPEANCAACHMGARRPEDVVHVVMTDHRISRRPPGAIEPLAEGELEIEGLSFPVWGGAPAGAEGLAFLAVSALRTTGYRNDSAYGQLQEAITALETPPREVLLEWARAALARGEPDVASSPIGTLLERDPTDLAALELRVALALPRGSPERARADAETILAADPRRAQVWHLLGSAELAAGRPQEAVRALEQAVALHQFSPRLWLVLGQAHERLGALDAARAAWQRAIVLEPRTTAAWLLLSQSAEAAGDLVGSRSLLEEAAMLVDDADAGAVLARLERAERRRTAPGG